MKDVQTIEVIRDATILLNIGGISSFFVSILRNDTRSMIAVVPREIHAKGTIRRGHPTMESIDSQIDSISIPKRIDITIRIPN